MGSEHAMTGCQIKFIPLKSFSRVLENKFDIDTETLRLNLTITLTTVTTTQFSVA